LLVVVLRYDGPAAAPTAADPSPRRVRGEYEGTSRHSLLVAIAKKEEKIESLSTGFTSVFAVSYIIRVWDENEATLSAKCAAFKNAVNPMSSSTAVWSRSSALRSSTGFSSAGLLGSPLIMRSRLTSVASLEPPQPRIISRSA